MSYLKPSGEAVGGREQLPRAANDPRKGMRGDAAPGETVVTNGFGRPATVSASRGPVAFEDSGGPETPVPESVEAARRERRELVATIRTLQVEFSVARKRGCAETLESAHAKLHQAEARAVALRDWIKARNQEKNEELYRRAHEERHPDKLSLTALRRRTRELIIEVARYRAKFTWLMSNAGAGCTCAVCQWLLEDARQRRRAGWRRPPGGNWRAGPTDDELPWRETE
jgi:hypothetical protein